MKRSILFLVIAAGVIGSLIQSRHAPVGYFNYYSELRGDIAGYYVYLPALFIYDFKGDRLPENLEDDVAYGFRVDSTTKKIHTKYPAGVAILQAPFFMATHAYQQVSGGITDGFSGAYHNVPNWASWVYSSLGLWWFFLFMKNRIGPRKAFILAILLYFGTNVLYYSIQATGMSHIYSFSLFAGFMLLVQRVLGKNASVQYGLVLGLIVGLIIAIRPLNVLFLTIALVFFFLDDKAGFLRSFKPRIILPVLVGGIITVIPQLLYWRYLTGEWVYYSYGNESFSNILHPDLAAFWFAPDNGLILYNPIYLIVLLALFLYLRISLEKGMLMLLSFFGLSFILASWHMPNFGCSYGSRNFVEYGVLFFIPLGDLLYKNGLHQLLRDMILVIAALAMVFNLKMVYNYNHCFFGEHTWDWEEFGKTALRGAYLRHYNPGIIGSDQEYGPGMDFKAKYHTIAPFYMADVSAEVEFYSPGEETLIALQIMQKDSTVVWRGGNIRQRLEALGNDRKFYTRFFLPEQYDRNATFRIYVYNLGKDSLQVKNLKVWLR